MIAWFLKGGPVMWPLLGCSIVAAAVIAERAWFWIRERRLRHPAAVHRILHLTERGLVEEAARAAAGSQDPSARILAQGLNHLHFSLDGALEIAVQEEVSRMRRYLGTLDTIITVAPLLGIFGTVTGILVAFGALEGRVPDPRVVAAGIAEAVITTVAGLAIAIPSVVAFNSFSGRIEQTLVRLAADVTNFQIVYQKSRQRGAGLPAPSQEVAR
jgi:biopolymer transport protein ExbB